MEIKKTNQKRKQKNTADQAIAYLSSAPLIHMGMIEPIRLGQAELLETTEHGVLMLEKRSGAWMISADSREYGEYLAGKLRQLKQAEECSLFMVCQPYLMETIKELFPVSDSMTCYQAVYRKKEPVHPSLLSAAFEIYQPGEQELEKIREHYHMISGEELKRLYEMGNLYCGYLEGKLAGFIGCHLEGSMGLLEVLPEYRRKGIGMQLEGFLINHLREQGLVPFAQVVEGNEASMALQKKLGLEISRDCIYWLF